VNSLSKKDINGGDERNKHTQSTTVPRQQPTVDSRNSQINAASEHACHTPEGAAHGHGHAIARPSVCLSVTRVDHAKTVEDRIMKLAPLVAP